MSVKTVLDSIVTSLRNNSALDTEFSKTLTGTVTTSATTMTGSLTAFTSELVADIDKGFDYIGNPTKGYRKVASIASNTSLVVASAFGSEFTNGAIKKSLIAKGMKRNIDLAALGKYLRVVYKASGDTEKICGGNRVEVVYGFIIIYGFYEPDAGNAEDRKSNYDALLRNAIEADFTFGGICEGVTEMGKTQVAEHPDIEGSYIGTMPLICQKNETRGNR